jgi:hypothetical protein
MRSVTISGNASGAGVLTIAAPNTASNYTLTLPTNTGTLITTASTGQVIPKAALPTGSVLQVVSTTKTDTFSTASTTFVDLTGLSVSITPTSTSSKILVLVNTNYSPSAASILAVFNLVRNSTNISQPATTPTYVGTATAYINAADNGMPFGFHFLDSPATTSSTTYKIQVRTNIASSFAVNTRTPSVDTASTSSITVMEIAA